MNILQFGLFFYSTQIYYNYSSKVIWMLFFIKMLLYTIPVKYEWIVL